MSRLGAPIAARRGDRPAIVDETGTTTWRQHDARVNRCLNGIRERGHPAGSTIALLCGNRREFLEASCALFHGGYLFPPINWHSSADEVAYVISDSGARAIIVDGDFADLAVRAVTLLDRPIDVIMTGPNVAAGTASFDQMLAESSADEPDDQSLGAVMMYTSGTTGRPKGVRSTGVTVGGPIELGQLAIEGYVEMFGIDVDGRTLINAPLYHGGPYVFGAVPFAGGCSVVLRNHFDPAETLRDIDRFGITNAYFVPTHFVRMLRLADSVRDAFDGSSLRSVWHTGAPCPVDVKRAMIEWWGPLIHETYAATDAGVGTLISSDEWLDRPGSVGRASPLSEILVVDDDGVEVPDGTTGTIYIRNRLGGDVSYHNASDKTAAAHLAPGVVTVGDVGHVDDDGYLYLSDRKIDMIISGGVNIYPAEIESRLLQHAAVADVAVFGVPDDDLGERVSAAILVTEDHQPSGDLATELTEFCGERLAAYKVPRQFEFPTSFPRTPTGKLVKRVLRDPHWQSHDRRI